MLKSVDVVFVAISSPILVGVYEDLKLIESLSFEQKSSDILDSIYKDLESRYEIKRLIYANGPGSFMAIKIAYIFLKTISIVKNIPLFGIDAFYFNDNKPIKAVGKLYFVKNDKDIITQPFDNAISSSFELPKILDNNKLNTNNAPTYHIGAL